MIDPEDHTSRIHIHVTLIPYILGLLAGFLGLALGAYVVGLTGGLHASISPRTLGFLCLSMGIGVGWNFSRVKNLLGDSIAGYLRGIQLSHHCVGPDVLKF